MSRVRDSRFELLRIIAALMILSHHMIQHCGYELNDRIEASFSLSQLWSTVIGSWGQLGVTVFVIISCWFMIDSDFDTYKFSKVVRIGATSWIYSVLIIFVLKMCGFNVGIKDLVKSIITPVYGGTYWFITAYIVFMFLVPFLRMLLGVLKEKQLIFLCCVLLIIAPIYTIAFTPCGGVLSYFSCIYFVTGYLKKHKGNILEKYAGRIFIFLSATIIFCIEVVAVTADMLGMEKMFSLLRHLHDSRNILTLTQAYSLFYVIGKKREFHSRFINEVAKTALGIYLLTENIVLRGAETGYSILWNGCFRFREYIEKGTGYYIVYTAFALIVAFTVAVVIDYCRLIIGDKIMGRMTVVDVIDRNLNERLKG